MISADTRPAVAMLVDPQWRQRIFLPASLERLSTAARLIPDTEVALSEERLPELLNGAVACLTGWGTPTLTDVILEQAPSLRLVAHTAGSVHHLVPETIFERGVRVTHAAAALAEGLRSSLSYRSCKVCVAWTSLSGDCALASRGMCSHIRRVIY